MKRPILEWGPEYKIGNATVDLQHQYFVELINRISVNFLEAKDYDYKKRLLSELVKYADFHFTSEENVAISCDLQPLQKHQERHKELLSELNMHVNDLLSGRYSTDKFIGFLHDWFAGHTIYEDRRLFKRENPY